MGTGSTKLEAVPEAEERSDFSERLTIRGKAYTIRELNAKEYEEVVQRATKPDKNGDDQIDMNLLSKFLVMEATSTNGKGLDIAKLNALPHPIYQKLMFVARRMHWGEIESDEEAMARAEAEEAAKAEGKDELPSP